MTNSVTFRRQWHRSILPAIFALGVGLMTTYYQPGAALIALPICVLIAIGCIVSHTGITITSTEITWFLLNPRWRYRTVPWAVVLDIRKTLKILHPVRLIVQHGKYEPWAWGTVKPGKKMEVLIWTNAFHRGYELWDTLQQYWAVQKRSSSELINLPEKEEPIQS
ncbi:MAG: hypothetical protein R3B84_18035 [Zavarzinella sp.]